MRLLVCVEAVDRHDPTLSFFLVWLKELARHFESLEVVALHGGEHDLPGNVRVHSLGKESATGSVIAKRLQYVRRLWRYAWKLRSNYDAVLVFQADEHVLAAGWLWTLLRKPIFFWRNHYKGDWRTNIALAWCRRVFYTSKFSYTARFAHARQMPLGIDLSRFTPGGSRAPHSILFLARMAPSKRAEVLIDAVEFLPREADFRVSFVGDPLPQDAAYYASLKEGAARSLHATKISFLPGVANAQTPEVYRSHLISVNISRSGMYDKTIFEAAACGCIVLACSKDFAEGADPRCTFEDGDARSLAEKLLGILALSENERDILSQGLRAFAAKNSLTAFGERLHAEITA